MVIQKIPVTPLFVDRNERRDWNKPNRVREASMERLLGIIRVRTDWKNNLAEFANGLGIASYLPYDVFEIL